MKIVKHTLVRTNKDGKERNRWVRGVPKPETLRKWAALSAVVYKMDAYAPSRGFIGKPEIIEF